MKTNNGLPSPAAFQKAVGLSCVKYCKSHGYPAPPAKKPRWDADNCKDAVRRFVQENGRLPDPSHEARVSFGLPTPGVFGSCTGIPMGQYMSETYPELVMPTESQWTKERIDAAAKQFFETHGRYLRAEEYNMAHGLPARNTFRNHFGIAAGTYWRERFPMEPEWSPEKVMKMFEAFIEEHGRLPNITELKTANGLPHFTTVLKHTGAASYEDFCQEYFPEFYVPHTKWDCESCIQAVRQFTHEHGRLPAAKDLRLKNGLPNIQTIKKYTGSITYQEFCRKYFPEFGPRRWDRDLCIQAVDQFIQEHGRLPDIGDTGCGLPCIDTFRRLVGETPYD